MKTDSETESEEEEVKVFEDNTPPTETKYIENAREELGQVSIPHWPGVGEWGSLSIVLFVRDSDV